MSPSASELAGAYGVQSMEYWKELPPNRPKAPVEGCDCMHCRYERGEQISSDFQSDGKCMRAAKRYWRGDYERARLLLEKVQDALLDFVPPLRHPQPSYLPTLRDDMLHELAILMDRIGHYTKDGIECRFCHHTTHNGEMDSSYASGHIPCRVPCSECAAMRRDDERLMEQENKEVLSGGQTEGS